MQKEQITKVATKMAIVGALAFLAPAAVLAISTPTFIHDIHISPVETHDISVAVDSADNIYALLSDSGQVQKFNSNLVQIPFIGTGNGGGVGSGANQFSGGTGIAIYRGGPGNTDPLNNEIVVGDRVNDRIKVLDVNGDLLFQFGSTGSGKSEFHGTIGAIDVDQTTGDIYVLDGLGYERVQKFDSTGNFILMWGWGVKTGAAHFEICTAADPVCFPGTSGNGAGQFSLVFSPGGVATDGTHVFVSDTQNFRIQKFDTSGNFVSTWGSAGSAPGEFASINGPANIRYSNGLLYVGDTHPNHRIQTFTTSGVFQGEWGNNTTFNFPTDIAILSTGEEVVSDFFFAGGEGRLSKWSAASPVNHHPTNKDQCKHGGYINFVDDNNQPFTNQGQCVSYVNHH